MMFYFYNYIYNYMEQKYFHLIEKYYEGKNLKFEIKKDYCRAIIKNQDIITDVDLLRYLLLNIKHEKKSDYEYFYYTTKSCKFFFSNEGNESKDLDLFYSYIIESYHNDIEKFYKFVEILHELKEKELINILESNFTKENSDEIKIFSKFLFYYIINLTNAKIDFDNFIYCKKFDSEINKNKIIQKINSPKLADNKIAKIIKECNEILYFFDEIYDTSISNNLNKYIIQIDKIYNNKLLITDEKDKFILQVIIKDIPILKIETLIKKIKSIFNKTIEIILYVDQFNNDSLFILFKEGFISHLIIKNPSNKNLLMLTNEKEIFVYYDLEEVKNSEKLIEKEFGYINKYLNNYFELMFLVFNQEYKIHKVKIDKNLTNFGFYIKDRVEQNYFNINEYKEEKRNNTLYLYSKDNTLCYEIFCQKYPIFEKIFSLFINKEGFIANKKLNDNLNSLIAIKGYDLIIQCSKIIKNKCYNKIIFQKSIEIDNDYNFKSEYEQMLDKKNYGFNTKNIYIVDNIEKYLDEKSVLPTILYQSHIKRGFNDLIPVFYFIYKKYPILDKKPVLLQISYFMSYTLNIYKNIKENDI